MAALHLRPRRTLPALSMPDDDDALFSSDMPPTSPLPRRGSANSLSVREAQLGQSERRRLRGLHTTSFLQPRRSGRAQVEEEAQAKTVPKLWLLVLLLLFAGEHQGPLTHPAGSGLVERSPALLPPIPPRAGGTPHFPSLTLRRPLSATPLSCQRRWRFRPPPLPPLTTPDFPQAWAS